MRHVIGFLFCNVGNSKDIFFGNRQICNWTVNIRLLFCNVGKILRTFSFMRRGNRQNCNLDCKYEACNKPLFVISIGKFGKDRMEGCEKTFNSRVS